MQPSDDRYRTLAQKPYKSHYLYVDTVIDHPVEKVWPHALNIGSWMSAHGLETLAGRSGEVGHFERVHPRGLGPQVGLAHHHLYGVARIIPHKLIALEVFAEKGGSYGDKQQWMSFDGILLTDMGARTHVVFHMVDVYPGPVDEEFLARRKRDVDAGYGLIESYFDNLKRLVGNGA